MWLKSTEKGIFRAYILSWPRSGPSQIREIFHDSLNYSQFIILKRDSKHSLHPYFFANVHVYGFAKFRLDECFSQKPVSVSCAKFSCGCLKIILLCFWTPSSVYIYIYIWGIPSKLYILKFCWEKYFFAFFDQKYLTRIFLL